MERFIGAIDQGTTSTRFMIFDHGGHEVSRHQMEHQQILPNPGWVEHNPLEIVQNVQLTMTEAIAASGIHPSQLAAIGITNQRETAVVWNPKTGEPLCNALVWQDTRTDEIMQEIDRAGGGQLIRDKAGLAPSTYFSAGKIRWILDHVEGVSAAAGRGEAIFGNIDTWVLWNLTGGPDGGIHATDVTNASRTMLMSLETLDWDDELLELFQIPRDMLPSIHPCSDSVSFGTSRSSGGSAAEVPITGIVGDQQAATVGQACFHPGEAKNTYGTGNFMLLNTGMEVVPSESGLLSTVCYQFGENRPTYALEGSVAVTGSAVQWLRDQLGIIQSAPEVEDLANTVSDNGGVYFVPAFSGLFAPHWRSSARGVIVGLSRFNTKAHLARATLEAICYQTREVLDAMAQDSGVSLAVLKVDGGASLNDTLMQLQADILGTPVVRPKVIETTALGAAYAAGLAVGYWKDPEDVRHHWQADRTWEPQWDADQRANGYHQWKKAIEKSFDWID